MRAIRTTAYLGGIVDGQPVIDPVTMMVLEDDLTVDADTFATESVNESAHAGIFMVADIFDLADDGGKEIAFMHATIEAGRRAGGRWEDERAMAILFYHDGDMLAVTERALMNRTPAPFDADDVEYTLKALAFHPNYRGQTVVCAANHGTIVTLDDGSVRREEIPSD